METISLPCRDETVGLFLFYFFWKKNNYPPKKIKKVWGNDGGNLFSGCREMWYGVSREIDVGKGIPRQQYRELTRIVLVSNWWWKMDKRYRSWVVSVAWELKILLGKGRRERWVLVFIVPSPTNPHKHNVHCWWGVSSLTVVSFIFEFPCEEYPCQGSGSVISCITLFGPFQFFSNTPIILKRLVDFWLSLSNKKQCAHFLDLARLKKQ